MWEHAAPLIGIPGAIKATIDLLALAASGTTPADKVTQQATFQLTQAKSALQQFAQDAFELAAFKRLHTMTNQLSIDLKETFAVVGPNMDRARRQHGDSLEFIEKEFDALWDGERGGNQLLNLRANPQLMSFLQEVPAEVTEKVRTPPWDTYYLSLLRHAHEECLNFRNFYDNVHELKLLNSTLNNYANRRIVVGIDEFDKIMDRLRIALDA